MAKYVFDNCFCIDLRVGCFIIGYLNLIVSFIETIRFGSQIVRWIPFVVFPEWGDRTASVILIMIAIMDLVPVAELLSFTIVLVNGLHMHKSGNVKAYLINIVIFAVVYLALLIFKIKTTHGFPAEMAWRIIFLLFNICTPMVIRSYYYKMLEESGESEEVSLGGNDTC